MKPNFRTIPKFSSWGSYEIHVPWGHLQHTILDFIQEYGLDLDPDFQRAHVWDEDQREKYMEFCLRGGRTGRVILFNHTKWNTTAGLSDGEFVIVDGKQRLETVLRFLRNELKVFGHYYKDFEGKLRITEDRFQFMVNDLPDKKSVLKWYLELNDGGVVHTKAELEKVQKMLDKENKK